MRNNSEIDPFSPEMLTALVKSYKDGDESSFDRLVNEYMPLIDSMVNRCYDGLSPYYEREDILQFALIAFSKAVFSYNTEQSGVTFGLYAKICIGNALITKLRAARRRHVEFLPIDDIFNVADTDDIAEDVIGRENVLKLYELIKSTLSELENKVFRLYAAGYSTAEIAERLGKTERSVDNAIFRARKKLKSVLNETPRGGSLIK